MIEKELFFPGWHQLTEDQRLIFQGLLEMVSDLENDLDAIQSIILENEDETQSFSPIRYRVTDEIDSANQFEFNGIVDLDELTCRDDIREFVRNNLKNKFPEKVVCKVCDALDKEKGNDKKGLCQIICP